MKNHWNPSYFKYDPSVSKTERGKVLIENHNRKVDEIDLAMQYGDLQKLCSMLTITEHSPTSKMANKHSLSTSVSLNDFCQARQCLKCRADGAEPVCPYCFSEGISNARPTVKYSTARNSMILWQNEIPAKIWKEVWAKWFAKWNEPDFRIQSLGDVRTVIEAENYISLEEAFRKIIFTEWSKNWRIWYQAFSKRGKPKNSRYIHSSLYLNEFDQIPEAMVQYTDFRFTVCTPEWLRMHPEIVANCCTLTEKHRQCRRDCNDCYSKHPERCAFDRVEVVRGYTK